MFSETYFSQKPTQTRSHTQLLSENVTSEAKRTEQRRSQSTGAAKIKGSVSGEAETGFDDDKRFQHNIGKEFFHPQSHSSNNQSTFPFSSKYSILKKPFQHLSIAFGAITNISNSSLNNTRSSTTSNENNNNINTGASTKSGTQTRNSARPSNVSSVPSQGPVNERHIGGCDRKLNLLSSSLSSNDLDVDSGNAKLQMRLRDIINHTADSGFEYFHENMKSMRQHEQSEVYRIYAENLQRIQKEITWDMRSIVIDWLIEVCTEYRLAEETLYLAVSMIDRVLTRTSIIRTELQLLGVTCVMIGSKWYEISPPSMDEWVYICDDQYTVQKITKMERAVLKLLQFQITAVTPYHYLRVWMKIFEDCDNNDDTSEISENKREGARKHMCFAQYCIAQCAVNGAFCFSVLPSQLVSSILFLISVCFEDFQPSFDIFKEVTSYEHPFSNQKMTSFQNGNLFMGNRNKKNNKILSIAKKVHAILVAYSKKMKLHKAKQSAKSAGSNGGMLTPAVYEKYSRSKFERVADLPLDSNWNRLVEQCRCRYRSQSL